MHKIGQEKKPKNIVKGAPSGLVISLIIHAGAFLLAGMLVVFTVINKEEKRFVPPKPVERPKMKLKKPKVKVKKNARPQATTRIVTKVQKADMPELNLPELGGMGSGLEGGSGIGGFDMLPDLSEMTSLFGNTASIGSDLVGTFYDFNRTRRGSQSSIDPDAFTAELVKFHNSGWKESSIAKYYKSPNKLYSATVAIPPVMSPMGPAAFGEPDNMDQCWIVVYRGQLVHKDGIKFRFVGNSDDKMAVRVGGQVVLDASREDSSHTGPQVATMWSASSADHRIWYMAHDFSAVSDLVELEPGEPKDIEILIGEGPGVLFNAFLWVMEEGVEYPKGRSGVPVLPVFKTAALTRRQQDMIYRGMPIDQVSVTNGPTFCDYAVSSAGASATQDDPEAAEPTASSDRIGEPDSLRTWTLKDGKTFEAEMITTMGKNLVVESVQGTQKKVPMEMLSDEDRRYVSLSLPPEFSLDMGKKTRQRVFKNDVNGSVGCNEYVFAPKIESSSIKYDHMVKVDYWAIGSEIGGEKFILLDKGSDSFNPSKQPKGTYSFSGRTVELYDWVLEHIYNERRGERYKGFLITVTDERGKIIAQRSSPTWLYKHLDNLKQLEVGSFMDSTCTRVWPTPLKVPASDK